MKNMKWLIAGCFVAVCAVGFAQSKSTFSSAADYFSASFDGAVEQEKSITKWSSGQLTSTIYKSQTGAGYFQVMVTPLPREIIRSKPAQDLLDAAREGTRLSKNVVVEAEQKLLVNGAPARRFIVDTPDGPNVVHLVVIANGRMYHASATVPREDLGRGVDFVRSFSLSAVVNSGG